MAADFPIPGKPIRLIVGFPPGGGTDLQARELGQALAQLLGAPVIVENRPGASTTIAAMEVARSPPDGHTLLYTPSSTLTQVPLTLSAVRYDSFKDFTPVSMAAVGPLVLLVHTSVPVHDVKELIAYAKAAPGRLNYVSQGIGTSAHIYGDLFARQTGIDIVHVPYKGANDVANDFLSGRVQLQFASSSAAVALEKSGKVRLLAVVARERSALFPKLPTMQEQGVPGMDIDSWIGCFGPAGMAPPTVDRLNKAIGEALRSPALRKDFELGGVEARSSTPQALADTVRATYDLWSRMLRKIDFKKE
ncbi:MAG: tripartite tricarboxylate transporter substrate binding protein [Variovorax sp.]|nr:tripartite tricarboxylate transporter substrate binding protein [Variovorax sp.]